jgi:hypothetical protein
VSVYDDVSLDISVDANPTQAAMPKKAMCRMMNECAVVVWGRVLNPCGTLGEIFVGMQEPKEVRANDPDCRHDPDCHSDCRHTSRYHAPAIAIGVSR